MAEIYERLPMRLTSKPQMRLSPALCQASRCCSTTTFCLAHERRQHVADADRERPDKACQANMYETESFWEDRNGAELESGRQPDDWLCEYDTLKPLITPLYERQRCSVLVVGSGCSTFPEDVYDSGVREVVMLDMSKAAVAAVTARNAEGGRRGLRCVHADVGQPGMAIPGTGPVPPAFDVAVDKGTLDCILAGRDGQTRAQAAITNMYNSLKTPGTLVLVSHSCPAERISLLETVYWHQMQVKQVRATPWDKLAVEEDYQEELVDWEAGPAVAFAAGQAWVYILEK